MTLLREVPRYTTSCISPVQQRTSWLFTRRHWGWWAIADHACLKTTAVNETSYKECMSNPIEIRRTSWMAAQWHVYHTIAVQADAAAVVTLAEH
jgi:hypothetical protein